MEKHDLGIESSRIVSLGAIVFFLALGIAAAFFGNTRLTGIFLFLGCFGAVSRFWGRRAMDRVELRVKSGTCALYPGMETELEYEIENGKLLPLIWMELSQNAAPRGCLEPADGDDFERYECRYAGEYASEAYRRNFSFIMGMETAEFSSVWKAVRRGVYKPDRLLIRTGDGFGLTQIEKKMSEINVPQITVYPRRVAVDISPFIINDFERTSRGRGFAEDVSVLRALKPYEESDSWKRICWRYEARGGDELRVNRYETMQPLSIMFIFDGESYCGRDDGFAALESGIEVLASAITELTERNVLCSLCLPVNSRQETGYGEAVNTVSAAGGSESVKDIVSAGKGAAERMGGTGGKTYGTACIERADSVDNVPVLLAALAGYNPVNEPERTAEGTFTGRYRPSVFNLQALRRGAAEASTVCIFSYERSSVPARLTDSLPEKKLRILTCADNYGGLPAAGKDGDGNE